MNIFKAAQKGWFSADVTSVRQALDVINRRVGRKYTKVNVPAKVRSFCAATNLPIAIELNISMTELVSKLGDLLSKDQKASLSDARAVVLFVEGN